MAAANQNIRADAIEATEFMELSRRYRVTGVPKTIVNKTIEIMGGLPSRCSCEQYWNCPKMRTRRTRS